MPTAEVVDGSLRSHRNPDINEVQDVLRLQVAVRDPIIVARLDSIDEGRTPASLRSG